MSAFHWIMASVLFGTVALGAHPLLALAAAGNVALACLHSWQDGREADDGNNDD